MDFCCVTVNLPDVPLRLCSILAIPPSLAINFQYPSFFLYMNNLVDKTIDELVDIDLYRLMDRSVDIFGQ